MSSSNRARKLPRAIRRRSGFTLIELLVVIAIISLLVSILMPTLSKARDMARLVSCANNSKGLGLAIAMYANDQQGYRPMYWRTAGDPATWSTNVIWSTQDNPDIWDALGRLWGGQYMDNNMLLVCPDDSTTRPTLFDYANRKWDGTDAHGIYGSYALRNYGQTYHTHINTRPNQWCSPSNYVGMKLDDMANRSLVSCNFLFRADSGMLGFHASLKYPVLFGGGDAQMLDRPEIIDLPTFDGNSNVNHQIRAWDEFDILGRGDWQ